MAEILAKLDTLLQWNFPEQIQGTVNVALIWCGFAFIVGLITRVLVPIGQWRRGAFTVFLVGLTGSCVGFLALSTLRKLDNFNPFSPAGLVISVVTAIAALFLYRMSMFFFTRKRKDS